LQRPLIYSAGMEPFPGFRLRELRGRGAFAEVWEALSSDGTSVALKFMTSASPSVAAREVRSIQAIRQLRHPGMIRIDQVWFQGGAIVVAMELADGSLLELLEAYQTEYGTNVPAQDLIPMLRQAADALDFLNARAHDHSGSKVAFQHCDIKPSNLLLVGETVKLADFGLSTALRSSSVPFPRCGTLDFVPPEVFQETLTDRSDQFALAVTWCYMRTARLPFPEPPGGKFVKGYVRPQPDLRGLTESEQAVLRRALGPVPQDRWPSCTALIDALDQAMTPSALSNGHGRHHSY
jgi:serine/threonine protein kinase